jgi:Late embryogenesis abundant protein
MTPRKQFRHAALVLAAMLLGACAAMQTRDPLQVTVAGIEPMQGQGMELRMLVKLRVQNPNDTPVDYNGVSVKIDVQGNTFATGVSDESGSVPRFGESIVSVPVTASAMRMVRGALGMMGGKGPPGTGKVSYSLTGKLHGPTFSSVTFETKGDLELPAPGTPASVNPT